ncbi:MAG: hypothetical protein KJ941_11685 [Bacteroidetes bacterium]|nr:hypothetical protein [Bacteroidota bacterium]
MKTRTLKLLNQITQQSHQKSRRHTFIQASRNGMDGSLRNQEKGGAGAKS